MKTISAILLALCVSTPWAGAQTIASPSATVSSSGKVQDTDYAVVERGPNHRVWQRTTYETTPDGKQTPHIHAYTELATGLHYLEKGQWVESKEEIEILPNGTAVTRHGQHTVVFPGNIADGIELVTPDGKHLKSRPLGLSYADGNKTVLIAELKDSIGELVGPNQVIYPDAFTDFKADIRYTYTKAGFEQDIILRESPLTPESYSLNPNTARLQVLTEFFDPPQPAVRTKVLPKQAGITLNDDDLDFGVMKMTPGRAFLLGSDAHEGGAAVGKSWVKLEGRQFLVEEVPVNALADELGQLPVPQQASAKSGIKGSRRLASNKRQLPAQRMPETNPGNQSIKMAQAGIPSGGLVLDYVTINANQANYVFQGDTTYYISGNVYLSGTSTFEGGAVIKYANSSSAIQFQSGSAMNCQGAAYRPIVMTSMNDNSVGETISGSTGNPAPSSYTALVFSGCYPPTLSHIRVSYAGSGLVLAGVGGDVSDAQFVNCAIGLNITAPSCAVTCKNALFSNMQQYDVSVYYNNTNLIAFQNVTFDRSPRLLSSSCYSTAVNCIMANVTNTTGLYSGDHNGFYKSPPFGSGTFTNTFYPFQAVGAGNYYLTNGCSFTNAGTANIDPALLANLRQKTTYPPMVYSNVTFTVATNFLPMVPRDTNAQPDLGYHYDPIDYLMDNVAVSNATLTVSNGTAIACYNEPGIQLQDGSAIISVGAPLTPNWFARYQSVQEQALRLGGTNVSYGQNVSASSSLSTAPSGTFRFTKFACPAGGGRHLYSTGTTNYGGLLAQDCEFWGGQNDFTGAAGTTTTLKNNLFYRSSLTATATNLSATLALSNNLMYGAAVTLRQPTNTIWYAFNNEFDTCGITNSTLTNGYNAYVNCSGRLSPTNANDVVLTSFTYASGTLGKFYQSSTSLVDKGSCTADLTGLYHYTTRANQVQETNSYVDIGYHYVATDTNGNPLDTLWLGIPDYLADPSGGLAAWEMQYFGQLGLDPNASYDGQGNTVLSDYQSYQNGNPVDPNVIQFSSIEVTNNYANTNLVPAQLTVTGLPYYIAVLMDDTNLTDAVWSTYGSSNITFNLGATQGWHGIWVGLRGHADAATNAAWQYKRLKLDLTPPQLVITNPVGSTVDVPMIQIYGYCPEPLDHISYDLTNALGLFTNMDAGVTGQFYDTNTWDFTTNYFECLDVPLTNGVNTITFHATDLAGNTIVTNFIFTVDYSSKTPPVLQLTWPQSGMKICGPDVTLRGQVDDPTVTVTATVTDTNGDMSTVAGEVERNGRFWVENLPLNSGTNIVSITMSNVTGQFTVTNLNLVQSPLALTINPVTDDSQLWQPTVSLSGTISDSSYVVWINGVAGVNNGDGTWSADNVPTTPGGVAVFDATAYPPAEAPANNAGGNGVNPQTANAQNTSTNPDKPVRLYVKENTMDVDYFRQEDDTGVDPPSYSTQSYFTSYSHHWNDGVGGGGVFTGDSTGSCSPSAYGWPYHDWANITFQWPASFWPDFVDGTYTLTGTNWDAFGEMGDPYEDSGTVSGVYDRPVGQPEPGGLGPVGQILYSNPLIAGEHCKFNLIWDMQDEGYGVVGNTHYNYCRTADTTWHLQTGGKATPKKQNLWQLSASASAVVVQTALNPPPLYVAAELVQGGWATTEPIAPGDITIDGEPVGSDGNQWRTYADDDDRDVTPRVKKKDFYLFDVQAQKYLSYFEVFVRMPDPIGHDSHELGDWGHSWWRLSSEASRDQINNIVHTNVITQFVGNSVGFFPVGSVSWHHPACPGYSECL